MAEEGPGRGARDPGALGPGARDPGARAGAWRVRPASPDDAALIVRFNRALARETEDRELDREVLEAGVGRLLSEPHRGRYFLAEAAGGGDIVGQLLVTHEWSDWRNGDVWWIQSVYIPPPHRRRGVYRALHERVREEAGRRGAVGLRLYVDRDNRGAQATYRSLGMEESRYLMFEEMWG